MADLGEVLKRDEWVRGVGPEGFAVEGKVERVRYGFNDDLTYVDLHGHPVGFRWSDFSWSRIDPPPPPPMEDGYYLDPNDPLEIDVRIDGGNWVTASGAPLDASSNSDDFHWIRLVPAGDGS